MNVLLIEQLIELNAVVTPSRCEFKSWSWNIYIGIIVLFISLLILYYYFYCSHFYSIYLLYYFAGMFFFFFCFFFFKLFAIYVLNILEYMSRQQQLGKTALICCRDAQADLGLRCLHMQKEPFYHDMALS